VTIGVHRAAATGFADGADIYAASRPAYPAEALDWSRGCAFPPSDLRRQRRHG
jgi:hypothetical protein